MTRQNRGLIAWMVANPVTANLLMATFLLGGVLGLVLIRQEVFPEVALDRITVSVPFPGASPAEVEQGVILVIEESVRSLDGVKEVRSVASEGLAVVHIDLLLGVDQQQVYQNVQQEIARIVSFPETIEEPRIVMAREQQEVLTLVLYSSATEIQLRDWAEFVRDHLLHAPDITLVELSAVRPREISVEVSAETLFAYDLTMDEIARRIREASVEDGGGGVKTSAGDVLIKMDDRRFSGREFAGIPILTGESGTSVPLAHLAEIHDGFEDVDHFATFNDQPAILIRVFRIGSQTPVQVSQAVAAEIDVLRSALPERYHLSILTDRADQYRDSVSVIVRNGVMGLALVFLLLGVFLKPRLAFWVGMGIPISFFGTLMVLPIIGISINTVSLFGFLVAIGIVVDDAIVVSENIFEHQQQGASFMDASVTGAKEVSVWVTFSVLTNIVAFLPFFMVPGFLGKLMRMIPVVVVLVLLLSLLESFLILPAHLGHGSNRSQSGRFARLQQRISGAITLQLSKWVGPVVDWTLHYRYLTIAIGLAVLILTGGYLSTGHSGFQLGPDTEEDIAVATVVFPFGSPLSQTMAAERRLREAAWNLVESHGGDTLSKGVLTEVGGIEHGVSSGGHVLRVSVLMQPPDQRPMSTKVFAELWRDRVGLIQGVESMAFLANEGGPGGDGPDIHVELSHRDLDQLEQAAAVLAEDMNSLPYIDQVNDGVMPGKQQRRFQLRSESLNLGLHSQEVAAQLRHAFFGAEALRQQRGRDTVKVMVRLPKEERIAEHHLETLRIRTPQGRFVALTEVAEMNTGRAFTEIHRHDGRRILNVTAEVTHEAKAGQLQNELAERRLPALVEAFPGLTFRFGGEQQDLSESMSSLGIGLVFALFAIYALVAIPFKSYFQPFIVMMTIPFGLIGSLLGHWVMGVTPSLVSVMGMVALMGVIVNNGLVMISFANEQVRNGIDVATAIRTAAIRRFRPILLTSLTTFCGLGPMIFETSEQAQLMTPIAISLGFGVLFATVTTLLTIPPMYLILQDIKAFMGRPTYSSSGT